MPSIDLDELESRIAKSTPPTEEAVVDDADEKKNEDIPDPETVTQPVTPTPQTLSKADIESILDEKLAKLSPEKKEEKVEEIKKYFADGYNPKTADEFTRDLLPLIKEEVKKELVTEAKEQEDRQAKVLKKFDEEYEGLVKEGKVPEVSTDEGKAVKDTILKLGLKHGKKNYTEAYELWSQIPKDLGGGWQPATAEEDTSDKKEAAKKQINRQKQVASRTKSKGGTPAKGPAVKFSAKEFASLDVSDIVGRVMGR